MNHLQRPIQLINILQTEIFQSDVVDATLVIPWHNGVSHNDNLAIGVVDATQGVGLLLPFLLVGYGE